MSYTYWRTTVTEEAAARYGPLLDEGRGTVDDDGLVYFGAYWTKPDGSIKIGHVQVGRLWPPECTRELDCECAYHQTLAVDMGPLVVEIVTSEP